MKKQPKRIITAKCCCGWKGSKMELLAAKDGNHCPRCRSIRTTIIEPK